MIKTLSFYDVTDDIKYYFLLDVESGALHVLDKPAYDYACLLEQGTEPNTITLNEYSEELITEIAAEFKQLQELGLLFSEQRLPQTRKDDKVIKAMCLHIAHDCNLRCAYCFAGTGEFSGERSLMSLDIGKAALDFLIAHSGKRKNLEVDLFGGEPLINFEVIKGIVKYGRELEAKHNKNINFTITTNGLALNDEISEFINKEMHNVVLSLDGRKHVHDALRRTVNGNASYDIILPKIQSLIRSRAIEKEWYVRGTFTNKNLDFANDILDLYKKGFDRISIEPVVLDPNDDNAIRKEHLNAIFKEYEKLANIMLQNEKNGAAFTFFHFMLDMDEGPCLKKRISGCGAGVEYIAVTPGGDIYPCHQFVGESSYKLGSVLADEFNYDIRQELANCNILNKPKCDACWAKYFCSGGCVANAYRYNNDAYEPLEISCAMQKKRTELALALAAINKSRNQSVI